MGVQIDIGDTARSRIEQRQDRKYRIVQIAEPGRPSAQPMMRAASRVITDTASAERQPCGQNRTADTGQRPLPKPLENRTFHCPEVEPRAVIRRRENARSRSLKRREIISLVKPREIVDRRQKRRVNLAVPGPSERPDKFDDGSLPPRRQGMMPSEPWPQKRGVRDEMGRT